jgi:hypothetical protein
MTGSRKGDAWYEGYLEQILAPGYLRVCLECREAEKKLQCEVCTENLPSEAFSKSVLKNQKGTGRHILCKECLHPQCAAENCKTCRSCRRVECQERDCRKPVAFDLHPKHLPRNKAERDQYRCEKCRSDQHSDLNKKVPQVLHKCDCCLDELPRTAFDDSAWAHRSDATRRTLCKECKHPQCAAENCKTCRSCRRVECQQRDCRKPVAFGLHPKQLPQNKAERDQYRCEKCRSDLHSDLNKNVPQVLHKCDCCLDELPRTAFEASAWANKSKATQRTLCKECKHPQCTVENCKTCRSCRSTKCKNKNCRKPYAFNIHQRNQPKDRATRERFRCENCCFPACSDCGAKMPEGGCRARFLQSGASTWTCNECEKFPHCSCCQAAMPKKRRQSFVGAKITTYTCVACQEKEIARRNRQHC